MIEISSWINLFLQELENTFADRVWFVGLQGSYARNEVTENSDIDVVVILDRLSASDIETYRTMLDTLPHRELICGFFSGKEEILNWETSDLFQFYYDTKSIRGSLDELQELLDEAAIDRAIKIGVCNVYHGCVHNMLHERSGEVLKGLYKAASFVVKAICFRQTGKYASRQEDLLGVVSPDEKEILTNYMVLKNSAQMDFQAMSKTLFAWSKRLIANVK